MAIRVAVSTLNNTPHAGAKAWGRLIVSDIDLDLQQYSGFAIKSKFTGFDRTVSVPYGGFIFVASQCDGSAAEPRYNYQLYWNKPNAEADDRDVGDDSDEMLVCITDELNQRRQLALALEQLVTSDRCPAVLRAAPSTFLSQATYAIGTNTIYRAAVLCYLILFGAVEVEGVLPGERTLEITKPPLPPPPKPYVPGMRKRKIDLPPPPDDFPD